MFFCFPINSAFLYSCHYTNDKFISVMSRPKIDCRVQANPKMGRCRLDSASGEGHANRRVLHAGARVGGGLLLVVGGFCGVVCPPFPGHQVADMDLATRRRGTQEMLYNRSEAVVCGPAPAQARTERERLGR